MASVAGMIRGAIAGLAVAFVGMIALFAVNFAVTQIPPDHYRRAVAEAVASGTLTAVVHLPLAPGKSIQPHVGNDCVTLGVLVMPRGSRIEASVSPRMPIGLDISGIVDPPGYPPGAFCAGLAAAMQAADREQFSQPSYLHRYIHGPMTAAALLIAVMPIGTASVAMVAACYALLGVVSLLALLRLRRDAPTERRRAVAFLIIAVMLACFYGLPVFDRSFSFGPTDVVVFAFILFGMLHPLGQIPMSGLIVAAAAFGTAIAMFEVLTGGVPMGLATLIALIALGEAPDTRTLMHRVLAGSAAFIAAVIACFAYKLLAVAAVFGTNELSGFVDQLVHRVGGSVQSHLPESAKAALRAYRIDPSWIDANILTRVLFAGVMLTYSSFFLGWGSHVLGAALVLLPTPLLVIVGIFSLRERSWSKASRERIALAAAGLVPILWYMVFANHTILHSSYMVRPLVLTAALGIICTLSYWRWREPV